MCSQMEGDRLHQISSLFLCLKVQNEYVDSGLLYSLDQGGQLGEGAFGVMHKAKLKMSAGENVTVSKSD